MLPPIHKVSNFSTFLPTLATFSFFFIVAILMISIDEVLPHCGSSLHFIKRKVTTKQTVPSSSIKHSNQWFLPPSDTTVSLALIYSLSSDKKHCLVQKVVSLHRSSDSALHLQVQSQHKWACMPTIRRIKMFIVTLFITAQTWRWPKSINRKIN